MLGFQKWRTEILSPQISELIRKYLHASDRWRSKCRLYCWPRSIRTCGWNLWPSNWVSTSCFSLPPPRQGIRTAPLWSRHFLGQRQIGSLSPIWEISWVQTSRNGLPICLQKGDARPKVTHPVDAGARGDAPSRQTDLRQSQDQPSQAQAKQAGGSFFGERVMGRKVPAA